MFKYFHLLYLINQLPNDQFCTKLAPREAKPLVWFLLTPNSQHPAKYQYLVGAQYTHAEWKKEGRTTPHHSGEHLCVEAYSHSHLTGVNSEQQTGLVGLKTKISQRNLW